MLFIIFSTVLTHALPATFILEYYKLREQECIPVGYVQPALHHKGGLCPGWST